MDNPQHPDPSQELPAPPEEKLLRAPTFFEKFGRPRTIIFIIILVIVIDLISWHFLQTEADIKFFESLFNANNLQSTVTPVPTMPN